MTYRQTSILTGLLRDEIAFKKQSCPAGYGCGMERHAWREAQEGLIRLNAPQWLGHGLSASDSVMLSRDYKALEERGLVERHALGCNGRQTTHLRLTESGRIAAGHLAAAEGVSDA